MVSWVLGCFRVLVVLEKGRLISLKKVKDIVLDDGWWEMVDITMNIMDLIISLLQFVDTNQTILGEVYEGWNSMIDSMKNVIL